MPNFESVTRGGPTFMFHIKNVDEYSRSFSDDGCGAHKKQAKNRHTPLFAAKNDVMRKSLISTYFPLAPSQGAQEDFSPL